MRTISVTKSVNISPLFKLEPVTSVVFNLKGTTLVYTEEEKKNVFYSQTILWRNNYHFLLGLLRDA